MKKYNTPEMKALSFVAEEAISVFNDGSFGQDSWQSVIEDGNLND